MAQLVEALRYKPEGCGFDSLWCHWNFSLIYTSISLIEFTVIVSLCVYLIDGDIVEAETCGRDISNKL